MRIKGTAALWTSKNPILASGDEGVESDTGRFKTGDGTTTWTALPYGAITATSTDTLTNKTIDFASNTVTMTKAQLNTAVSDADVATLTGTETLTNKTLTAPVISTISNTGTVTLPTATDTLVGRTTTDTLTNKTLTAPKTDVLATTSGSWALFLTHGGSVNLWNITNAGTGSPITLGASSASGDTNVSVNLTTKGSGTLQANGNPIGVKVSVPATASSAGVPGQFAADGSFVYICTATNTWLRSPLTTW
jgi:hypothetical protein